MDLKTCSGCKLGKPLSDFCRAKKGKFKKQNRCKECKRRDHKKHYDQNATAENIRKTNGFRKRSYGVSAETYKRMLDEQNGACLICGGNRSDKGLAVDHNHSTGEIRGLLCLKCNSGIGWMGDSSKWLRAAADYLDRFRN